MGHEAFNVHHWITLLLITACYISTMERLSIPIMYYDRWYFKRKYFIQGINCTFVCFIQSLAIWLCLFEGFHNLTTLLHETSRCVISRRFLKSQDYMSRSLIYIYIYIYIYPNTCWTAWQDLITCILSRSSTLNWRIISLCRGWKYKKSYCGDMATVVHPEWNDLY